MVGVVAFIMGLVVGLMDLVKRVGLVLAARAGLLTAAVGALAFSMLSVGVSFADTATVNSAWAVVSNSSLDGGESDLTGLVTNHLPYIVGIFVAMLALGWITSKISKTARGKKV